MTVDDYIQLITSQYRDKPKFVAVVEAVCQPMVDLSNLEAAYPQDYDLDTAVGVQLDAVGRWVGVSRYLKVPLADVYFSFDDVDLGFDSGVWQGPFDPSTGLTILPDDAYRILIRARIANNHWDGTIPGAYAVWDVLFLPLGVNLFIVDHGDMTMELGVLGGPFDAVTYALITGGYLDLRPSGVLINNYIIDTGPLFGFNKSNDAISGFDIGNWGALVPP